MMKGTVILHAVSTAILFCLPLSAWAQPAIVSEFAADAEDWTVSGGLLRYHDALGNPDGFIEFEDDADGAGHFLAPAQFLGDLRSYDQGSLSFDLRNTVDNGGEMLWGFGRVALASGETLVELDLVADVLYGEWSAFTLPLTGSAWGLEDAAWQSLLAMVTEIRIYMDAQWNYGDRCGLDNFQISPLPTAGATSSLGAIKSLY